MFAECDKHYPSRSWQNSLATAVTNITKPVTKNNFGPSNCTHVKLAHITTRLHAPFLLVGERQSPARQSSPALSCTPLSIRPRPSVGRVPCNGCPPPPLQVALDGVSHTHQILRAASMGQTRNTNAIWRERRTAKCLARCMER